MSGPFYSEGYVRLTASNTVISAGSIFIGGYGVESTSGGGSSPYFISGTKSTDPVAFRAGPGVASQGNILNFEIPVLFPTGCYVSFDANTSAVTVFYIKNLPNAMPAGGGGGGG